MMVVCLTANWYQFFRKQSLLFFPQFIHIPSTNFLLGTPERELSALAKAYGGTRESYREEAPQHYVQLPEFRIARTPITNGLYAEFVRMGGGMAPGYWQGSEPPEALLDHPVTDVSWHTAQAFCVWLSSVAPPASGRYRLPSEAEWELAARGADGRRFPWGNEWDVGLANTREHGAAGTTPVGSYPEGASPWGCLDMAGNVWEWTATLDAPYPYNPLDGREDPQAGGRRILRGGCYANPHGYARCACRFRLTPDVRNQFLGFRVAW
jgi:formylglycine-generating enzyme required for sulfatase activity